MWKCIFKWKDVNNKRLQGSRLALPILINDLLSPFFMTYALKISNFVDLETDKGKKCLNYPNKKHESYSDCDEEFVQKEIQRTYDIVPFWASKSNVEVTSSKWVKYLAQINIFMDLFHSVHCT